MVQDYPIIAESTLLIGSPVIEIAGELWNVERKINGTGDATYKSGGLITEDSSKPLRMGRLGIPVSHDDGYHIKWHGRNFIPRQRFRSWP